jgi:hypothetical protein
MKISQSKVPLLQGKPYWANGEPRGAVKSFFIRLVTEGCYTVGQIQDAMRERYPEIKEGTVIGYPRHAVNINGVFEDKQRFPYKAEIDSNGIIRFNKNFPRGSW